MPKRVASALSSRQVQTEKRPGLHADGDGLYLQVTDTGAKSWTFRFQLSGRRRDMGLGPAAGTSSAVSLADARQLAAQAKTLVRSGVDPIEHRAARRAEIAIATAKAMTFKQAAEAYIESMQSGWRNAKHASQWSVTLETYVYPEIGNLAVGSVDTGHVLKVLSPIWSTKTETASRVRGRIEAILDYAAARKAREGDNPARWKGVLSKILPAPGKVRRIVHHASMPYAELPAFWPKLQMQDGMGARALELTVLTACRTGEVLGAAWAEIDLEEGTWTIPPERMKAGAEHRVPLSDPAMALLRKLAAVRIDDFVFRGKHEGEPLSRMVMKMTLRRMKVDVTPHGFRATFRTWVADRTSFAHEIAEAALAHTIGDKTVAAYQRGTMFDKRRELMAAWAKFVQGRAAQVVGLRREA
jgi:integrase